MTSHHLNQCWDIVNWTLKNKLQWNFNRNSYIFFHENAFEYVVWEMVAILSPRQCVIKAQQNRHIYGINCLSLHRDVLGPEDDISHIRPWLILQRRHSEYPGVSNHQRLHCLFSRLFSRLFRRTSKKTPKSAPLAFCEGNPPVTGEFPSPTKGQLHGNRSHLMTWTQWPLPYKQNFNLYFL